MGRTKRAAAPAAAKPAAKKKKDDEKKITASPPQDAGGSFSAYTASESVSGGKFWSVYQSGTTVTYAYGKIGTTGTVSTKEFKNPEAALKEAKSKLSQKTRKGYSIIKDKLAVGEPASTTAAVKPDVKTLEDILDLPVTITGHWRYLDSQHTCDYVLKFVLRRDPVMKSNKLFHAQCSINDGMFNGSPKDEEVKLDEDKAKAVFRELAALCAADDEESVQKSYLERDDSQQWSSIEVTADVDGSELVNLLVKREKSRAKPTELDEKAKQFLGALHSLVTLDGSKMDCIFDMGFIGRAVDQVEDPKVKDLPMYL